MNQPIINTFFEDLAIKFKPIKHDPNGVKRFAVLNEDTVTDELRNNLNFKTWCMLLEETSPKIQANPSKMFFEYRVFRYTICRSTAKESHQFRQETFDISEQYGKNIFAKLVKKYEDSKRDFFNPKSFPLDQLELKASFQRYEEILGEPDIVGTDVQISIFSPFPLDIYDDPALWEE